MIGNLIYGLRWLIEHPIEALAATAIITSKGRIASNIRYAVARTTIYWVGQQLIDAGSIGKIFFEELKRPAGAKRPPLYRGSNLQVASAQARRGIAQRAAGAATRLSPIARFLIGTPLRAYLLAGTGIAAAGYAVGKTDVVRTAPSERGQPGMMMGVW